MIDQIGRFTLFWWGDAKLIVEFVSQVLPTEFDGCSLIVLAFLGALKILQMYESSNEDNANAFVRPRIRGKAEI